MLGRDPRPHRAGDEAAHAGLDRVGAALGRAVGLPSTKKSPIISTTIKPLTKLDAELLNNFLFEMRLYEQMEKEQRKHAKKPVQTRLRLEDTTIEGAQEVLGGSPNGVLLVQDELSGFFGSIDKYSGHRGAAKDRGFHTP